MSTNEYLADTDAKSSYFRLIEATFDQWQLVGGAAISARQLGASADVPVSSIYHHFGSLEHLFLTAQEQAQRVARQWCDAQLTALASVEGSLAAFGPFFAQIVDDWTQCQRRLAFAWRESHFLDGEVGSVARSGWDCVWSGFWRAVAAHFSFGPIATIAVRVFESECCLHMFNWRRTTDRAALEEMAGGLAAWLGGKPMPDAPWRESARQEAWRNMPVIATRDEMAANIAKAAASIMSEAGVAALTHRSVAQRAGVTLGLVSYKFRTKSALLEAAYEQIYADSIASITGSGPPRPQADTKVTLEALVDRVLHEAGNRANDELLLAVARDPALNQFAAQLRYIRGRTSRSLLERLLDGKRPVGNLEAALLSGVLVSEIRHYAKVPKNEAREAVRGELSLLLEHLRGQD